MWIRQSGATPDPNPRTHRVTSWGQVKGQEVNKHSGNKEGGARLRGQASGEPPTRLPSRAGGIFFLLL